MAVAVLPVLENKPKAARECSRMPEDGIGFEIPEAYRDLLIQSGRSVLLEVQPKNPEIAEELRAQYSIYRCKCERLGIDFMLWSCLYLHFHYYLSPAERKILAYIVLGYANNAIAEATYTSVKGIEATHSWYLREALLEQKIQAAIYRDCSL